jgi:hypothetical protein
MPIKIVKMVRKVSARYVSQHIVKSTISVASMVKRNGVGFSGELIGDFFI